MPDDPRRTILARRARFLAAALVGVTPIGCEKDKPKVEDEEARPQACLKVAEGGGGKHGPRDAGPEVGAPGDASPPSSPK